MAEHQVELGVTIASLEDGEILRDVDLLESLGQHIEELAGEMGPATAITGDRYTAVLTIDANTPLEAAERGVEVFSEAIARALAEHGHEVAGPLFDRLRVDRAELATA